MSKRPRIYIYIYINCNLRATISVLVAQWLERLTGYEKFTGSIPVTDSEFSEFRSLLRMRTFTYTYHYLFRTLSLSLSLSIYIYMRWGLSKQVLWNIKIVYIYILSISIYCILRLHIYTPVPKLTKAVLLLCMSKKWSKSLNKVTVNTFIMAIFRTFIKDNFLDQAKHAFQCVNKLFFGVFKKLQIVKKCSPLRFGEKWEFWSSEFLSNYINEF